MRRNPSALTGAGFKIEQLASGGLFERLAGASTNHIP
ncbi:hypothetical protein J2X50_002526 [Aminobacter sp. BE322]